MKALKTIGAFLLIIALLAGLYVGGAILYATGTDYQPPETQEVPIHRSALTQPDSIVSFMIWNIGYAGLGKEVDFFYDGGETVHPPKKMVDKYLQGIRQVVAQHDTIDFFLFQEVDTLATRSHGIHELNGLAETLDAHAYSYATNYLVNFIPIPLTNPLGQVSAGLASFSEFQPKSAVRYSFPGNYNWPSSVFFLDRCFLVHRYPLQNGRELVVVNTHNSAYDDGKLKQKQMDYLKQFLVKEYQKDNYVVVGGDWNQCPPGFDPYRFVDQKPEGKSLQTISKEYLSGWQWVYDPNVPTNRSLQAPYVEGETFTSLIDFYLLSPNLAKRNVKGLDLGFQYSDHQPVLLTVQLKN